MNDPAVPTFRSRPEPLCVFALICHLVLLAMFLWNQLVWGLNMLPLILILSAFALLTLLFLLPQTMRFESDALCITQFAAKKVRVPYDAVFNCDAKLKDSFLNAAYSSTVKVYYRNERNKKSALLLRPERAELFVDELKRRCKEFWEETNKESAVDVFFRKDGR